MTQFAAQQADVILVARDRVSNRLFQLVSEVCERAGALPLPWEGGALPELAAEPALVVSALREGERRIPDSTAQLLSRFLPDVPLLLLTEERLTQGSVLLQGGRVLLLGAPLSDLRVKARVASLVLDRRARPSPSSSATTPRTSVRVSQLGRAYVGALAFQPLQATGAAVLPTVFQRVGRGLTGFLQRAGAAPTDASVARTVASALMDAGQEAMADAVTDPVRTSETALVHLNLTSDEWVFHVPRPDVMISLSSPYRSPACFDVAQVATRRGATSLTVPARAGDVVWAAAGDQGLLQDGLGLRQVMLDGGAALVRALEIQAADRVAVQCLVVEVR